MQPSSMSLRSGRCLRGNPKMPAFYEFFAGGGMARAGLGDGWACLFANDIDAKKGAAYTANWGDEHLLIQDIGKVEACQIPPGANRGLS